MSPGKLVCAAPDDHAVIRALHDQPRHLGGMQDVFDTSHRPGVVRGPVHDRRVKLDDPVLVWQAAEAHAVIRRIRFHSADDTQGRV